MLTENSDIMSYSMRNETGSHMHRNGVPNFELNNNQCDVQKREFTEVNCYKSAIAIFLYVTSGDQKLMLKIFGCIFHWSFFFSKICTINKNIFVYNYLKRLR